MNKLRSFGESSSQYEWLNSLYNAYQSWITLYTTSLYSKELEILCEPSVLEQSQQITQQLIDKYPSLRIQIDHVYNSICSLNITMKWAIRVQKYLDQISKDKKVEYNDIDDLFNAGLEIEIPLNFSYFMKVSALRDTANKLKDQILEFSNTVDQHNLQKFPSPKEALSHANYRFAINMTDGHFQQNLLINRTKGLYSYEKAVQLLQNLEASEVLFTEEISFIKPYVSKYELWLDMFREFKFRYKLDCFLHTKSDSSFDICIKNINCIVEDLDRLKVELDELKLRDCKEVELFVLEWVLIWILFLKRQSLTELIPIKMRPQNHLKKCNTLPIWNQILNCIGVYEQYLAPLLIKRNQKHLSYIRKL